MANRIFLRRGLDADIPTLGIGEPGFATDTGRFYIGSPSGNILVAQVMGGGTGPQGPQGDEGPAGPAGAQGPAGAPFQILKIYADRATLEADSAPLHDSDGTTPFSVGEFAIVNTGDVEDADDARLYMWNGSSFDFVTDLSGAAGIAGPAGADGADGAQGPAGVAGADGKSAYQVALDEGFVGTEAAWLASLVGADGADGADGAQGPQGIQGIQGDAGNDGADGATGATGAAGADGADGDSAYQVAVNEGFVGDEATWLASLVGADGADGSDGAAGAQGIQGVAGNDGADGADGADGKTVLSGVSDPTTEGVDGDFFINITSNEIFGPKASGVWGSGTSLVGPQGLAGNDGADGAQGPQGIQGDPGNDGADGATGAAGADGADGDATAYTAANAVDWSGSAPTTIAAALDRLAAALGPIA